MEASAKTSETNTPPCSIDDLVAQQRKFFLSGKTLDLDFRRKQLRLLGRVLQENEDKILDALHSDMRKPRFEAFAGEMSLTYEEIRFALKSLKTWAKPQRVRSALTHFPAKSYIYSDPYGVTLIISPWNYPIQLLLVPLIGAMAAGNCAIVKPSNHAPQCHKILSQIFAKHFDPQYLACVEGGREANQALLKQKFDYIFFTGSPTVGRVVMEAAAKHLTPMTLELGGKSPCIILPDADIDVAARRIVWGKFFNAGQTCVAPDYLLIPPIMKNRFLEKMKETLVEFFGDDPINSPDFARIIDAKNVTRLKGLLGSGTVFVGGEVNEKERYIAPTILDKVSLEDPVMQEEIFGPILPVLDYQELQGAIQMIRKLPRPLALYIFTKDREYQERVLNELSFGGGCVNDTLLQFDNPRLPIGGVGDSGMGHYHGKYSFDTFSKKKGVVKKPFFMDIKFRYPPYDKKLELFLKLKKRPSFSEED